MNEIAISKSISRKSQYRNVALLFVGVAMCSAFIPLTFYTSVFDNFVFPILENCSECTMPQFFRLFVFTLELAAIVASGFAIIMFSLYLYEKIKISKSRGN